MHPFALNLQLYDAGCSFKGLRFFLMGGVIALGVSKERNTTGKKDGIFQQFMKYGGVSIAQTFVELGIFTALSAFLSFSAANLIAVVCSASFQYVANRNVTFRSSSSYVRSVSLFVLLWLWNLAFSTFAIARLSVLGLSLPIAKLFAMVCQGLWGFLLSKYVIFR